MQCDTQALRTRGHATLLGSCGTLSRQGSKNYSTPNFPTLHHQSTTTTISNVCKMPRARNLEPLRDEITIRFTQESSITSLLEWVNGLLHARGHPSISRTTLRRQVAAWGLSRRSNLEPFYEDISELFVRGDTIPSIHQQVNQLLSLHNYRPVTKRTLESRLQAWGLCRQQQAQVTDQLIERVQFYYSCGYSDSSILEAIQSEDQLTITPYAIRRIRYQHGMKRRIRNPEERR